MGKRYTKSNVKVLNLLLIIPLLLKKQTCDIGHTFPCRCPTNMGDERCNYKYGMLMTF